MMDKDMLEAIGQMLAPIREDLSDIKQRVTKIEVTQENVTNKSIQLLLEGQKGMNEKFKQLDQVAEDVEEIKIKVSALESVTRDNVTQIKELRKAN